MLAFFCHVMPCVLSFLFKHALVQGGAFAGLGRGFRNLEIFLCTFGDRGISGRESINIRKKITET